MFLYFFLLFILEITEGSNRLLSQIINSITRRNAIVSSINMHWVECLGVVVTVLVPCTGDMGSSPSPGIDSASSW